MKRTALSAQVESQPHAHGLSAQIAGKPFTELFFGPETATPDLHPLRPASGRHIHRIAPLSALCREGGEAKEGAFVIPPASGPGESGSKQPPVPARGDGLFAANLLGARWCTNGQSENDAVPVKPGKTLRLRDRILIHSGKTNPGKLAPVYASRVKGRR